MTDTQPTEITTEQRIHHARSVLEMWTADGEPHEQSIAATLRFLLREAESAGRARQLAEEWEASMKELDAAIADGRCPKREHRDAGLIRALTSDHVRLMRQALDGTAPGEGPSQTDEAA